MTAGKGIARGQYDWMLGLSAEGWAWEFLRRNPDYRREFLAHALSERSTIANIALRWGLLDLVDPDVDARSAVVFWAPLRNQAVLSLVAAEEASGNALTGVQCKVSVLETVGGRERHVLYSCDGRFLQLVVKGEGLLSRARYMMDALPEHSGDRKILSLRRLADLSQHKRLRPHLYGRQRRAPRLLHIAMILDSYAKNPAHRVIAREVFGKERADAEWDNLRDHVRRAVAAGRKLSQGGYLDFLS